MIAKLCDAKDLPDAGKMKSFAGRNGLQICVTEIEGKLVAFDNHCPHQGAPLSAGHLDGCMVVCPYHAWRFDVTNGKSENIADPDLGTYEIRRYDDEVFVRLPNSI
ncbi:Rieske 2Fe-2S domain-containing protein [Terriglobus sp. TAA 43]|uniref:Rieske (2Fe-2S) protein n=1 Tax=Terriglobus sp. TAA 43 TaxID=278961 RepID=UPI000648B0C1|nr:Rieske 2Fe-2S domain-containing protein [Terriglobus sp. TAA 43]